MTVSLWTIRLHKPQANDRFSKNSCRILCRYAFFNIGHKKDVQCTPFHPTVNIHP